MALYCHNCGDYLVEGELVSFMHKDPDGKKRKKYYPQFGSNKQPIICQPVSNGAIVNCVKCYEDEAYAARFVNDASIAAAKMADFPKAPEKTEQAPKGKP